MGEKVARGIDNYSYVSLSTSSPPRQPANYNPASIRLGFTFPRLILSGAPLLRHLTVKSAPLESQTYFHADPARLYELVPPLQAAWDYYLTLPAIELNTFTGVHWNNFIVSIIFGFRLSFPLAVCPEWDDKLARSKLRFHEYVERFCRGWGGEDTGDSDEILERLRASRSSGQPTAANKTINLDILSASKVVLDIVRKQYTKKVAKCEPRSRPPPPTTTPGTGTNFNLHHPPNSAINAPPPVESPRRARPERGSSNCPMMDGSMEPFYPYFDETFSAQLVPPLPVGHAGPVPNQTQAQQDIYHNHRPLQQQQQQPPPTSAMGLLAGLWAGVTGGQATNIGPVPTETAGGEAAGGGGGLLVDDGGFNNDLWATMTMDWAGQGDITFDDI